MEFPVLQELPLPANCHKLVTQFLRPGPHPTARLIEALTFQRGDLRYNGVDTKKCLFVTGPGVRLIDPFYPLFQYCMSTKMGPCYICNDKIRFMLMYEEITGEHIRDDDDVESDSDSDGD